MKRIASIRTWRGALSYLQRHSSPQNRQLYGTLCKHTLVELEKIVDKELHKREHDYALLVNVSRQEPAASRMHTKQVQERFNAAATPTTTSMASSTAVPTTISTATSTATGSTLNIERSPDEGGDDDENGDDSVLDPHAERVESGTNMILCLSLDIAILCPVACKLIPTHYNADHA
ncbi:MAG: hypothetical protein JOS17DRAFT_324499 [Linnemannia elongata]|nr:MAG: hypothetical protein JOS17DRAFT_324499 [Linnemannia elongata]